jgi:hypothetical protein
VTNLAKHVSIPLDLIENLMQSHGQADRDEAAIGIINYLHQEGWEK